MNFIHRNRCASELQPMDLIVIDDDWRCVLRCLPSQGQIEILHSEPGNAEDQRMYYAQPYYIFESATQVEQ